MGTKIEFRQSEDQSVIATVKLNLDKTFPLVITNGGKGPSGEIGYEVIDVKEEGTVVQPLFSRPEAGKLPQGSLPFILVNESRVIEGVLFQGEETSVSAKITNSSSF